MSDKEYIIGKGRPPKHTRFKPGQSGNPKGKKKGTVSLKTKMTDVFEIIFAPADNLKNTDIKKDSALKVLIAKTFVDALKGDEKSRSDIINLIKPTLNSINLDDDVVVKKSLDDQEYNNLKALFGKASEEENV